MHALTALTFPQLRSATKAQIVTSIRDYLTANFTKRQLIQLLRDRDTEWDDPVQTYRPDGQIESQTEVERDEETGVQVSAKVITYSYYATGEVNKIIISILDENNVEVRRKTIKHFTDGKQPEVKE